MLARPSTNQLLSSVVLAASLAGWVASGNDSAESPVSTSSSDGITLDRATMMAPTQLTSPLAIFGAVGTCTGLVGLLIATVYRSGWDGE